MEKRDKKEKKRKDPRSPFTSAVLIRILKGKDSESPFNGLVMNVSKGGAEFGALQPVKKGEEIEAVLFFLDKKVDSVQEETVRATAIWETKLYPFYIFGVKFSGINKKDHPGLIRYLNSREEE